MPSTANLAWPLAAMPGAPNLQAPLRLTPLQRVRPPNFKFKFKFKSFIIIFFFRTSSPAPPHHAKSKSDTLV
jgi:hypothetical protein